jgi:hypothetical protein
VKIRYASLLAVAALPICALAQAASPTLPSYNPLQTFAPLTLPDSINVYRSSDGAPGPNYWQNRADYKIQATIDVTTKTLTAAEVITYTNNSPNTLSSLWLHLEQTLYRKDSRAKAVSSACSPGTGVPEVGA